MTETGLDVATVALEAAVTAADAGMVVADGTVVAATDEWCDYWGTDREAVVGEPVETAVDVGDGEIDLPSPGETVRVELDDRQNGTDGGTDASPYAPATTLEVTAATTGIDAATYRVYTCRDVTDRVALERDSNVLDAVFDHLPYYMYLKNREGRHVPVSDYNEYARDYIGKTDIEVFGDEAEAAAAESYAADMRVGEDGEHIVRKEERDEDNNEFFLTTKVPWRDDDGEIGGLVGVTQNVTDRRRQRQQLERQNERLRTVASAISHDVRNPLQIAYSRIELASADCDSEHLDTAADALDRMDTLLGEVLAMVRHGQWVEETAAVSIRSAARDVWPTATDPAATLTLEEAFTLAADEARLQQLLENLFRNAVIHAGPDVHVRIGRLSDRSGFYVADDGPGIPPDERDRVFDLGYTTAADGTGLGLAIVEVIADAHGWEVTVTGAEPDDSGESGGESIAGESGARFEFVGVEFE